MVDAPEPSRHEDLAAELALGLLDGDQRAEALRLCLSDPAFAAAVEAWGHRLAPLLDAIPAERPPARLWDAIEARVSGNPSSGVVRSLRIWRAGALGSTALAACLALFILVRTPEAPAPRPQVTMAQLTGAPDMPMVSIAYNPDKGMLYVGRAEMRDASKAPELWIIPADGVPRSLGMIARERSDMPVGAEMRGFIREGATLAVTMEDPATAPHAAPSAAPVLSGKISTI